MIRALSDTSSADVGSSSTTRRGAVAMARAGRLDDARRTMATALSAGPGWAELLRRVVDDGQIELEAGAVEALLENED